MVKNGSKSPVQDLVWRAPGDDIWNKMGWNLEVSWTQHLFQFKISLVTLNGEFLIKWGQNSNDVNNLVTQVKVLFSFINLDEFSKTWLPTKMGWNLEVPWT